MTDGTVPQSDESKAKVFISYGRKDIEFADRLFAALQARGFEPLIDRTDLSAFEESWDRTKALIRRADTVVFVISPEAVASEIALKEVAEAASLNKRFVPVVWRWVTDKLIPAELAKLNVIPFDAAVQFDQRADQLAEVLNTDIGWIRQQTVFGEQARRWAQGKGASARLLRSPVLEQAEQWIAARPPGAPLPTEETQAFIRDSRRGATRRQKVLTGSLGAGLILALALAGVAYWQRSVAIHQTRTAEERQQFADQQRTLAEQQQQATLEQRTIAQQNEAQARSERDNAASNFKLAQKTAESLAFDIAQKLRDTRGISAEAARKILDTIKASFEQLATSAPADLTLQRSREAMLVELGDTYKALGDLNEAHKAYSDSVAIMERLVDSDPSNADWQVELSMLYERVGNVLEAQGKLDEALRAYRNDFTIIGRLAAADHNNTERQGSLSVSYQNVGDVLLAQGKFDEALRAYRDGLAIKERLAAADPSNMQVQRDLSISYNNVGDVLRGQGKLDEALKAYRDSFAIRERLAAADRSNTRAQRDLSVSYVKIGDIMAKQGQTKQALANYRKALEIMEPLALADPNNIQWQTDVIEYNHDLAIRGDDPARRFAVIVSALRKLQVLTSLTDEQKAWLSEAEKQVSKLKQSKGRP